MTLFINGRFLTQPLSGVQRYARELLQVLDEHLVRDPTLLTMWGQARVLVPRGTGTPDWKVLRVQEAPGGTGHVWEQGALYRASRAGILLSLGNTGPLRHSAHVLCLHDAHLFEMPQAFSTTYRMLHRTMRPVLARRARALITVSRHSARRLAHCLGVDEHRFQIIGNSAEHVQNWPITPDALARYGLARGQYLLCVGNQSPNKNIARLTKAHRMTQEHAMPLAVVGGAVPGVEVDYVKDGDGCRFLGRVPDADLRALYTGAAAFVFPSLHEGFGIPPLEAMTLGVPVLCASSGAMPEVLGDAPIWFDPRDPQDIAGALRSFSKMDAAAKAQLVARGYAQADRYKWSDSAARLVNVINNVTAASWAAA